MRNQESFFRPLVRNGTKSYPRSTGARRTARLAVAGALALATTARASVLLASDDIQQIKLGTHLLYVPKDWMTDNHVTAYPRPQGMVQRPQPTVIAAESVSFRPSNNWQPYNNHQLPEYINVKSVLWHLPAQTSGPIKTANRQLQKWMSKAARSTPDQDGFVRVEAYFGPNEIRRLEVLLYKPSINSPIGPLVVSSNSLDLLPRHRLPSFVDFITSSGLSGQYRFDNTKFPESTWWDLYQRVLAFVDYLQTPK